MAHAADTDVLRVKAGDELTFLSTTLAQDAWQAPGVQWDGCPDGKGVCTPGSTSSPVSDFELSVIFQGQQAKR